MNYSMSKDSNCIELRIKIAPKDIAFLSNERFEQLMPSFKDLQNIQNNRKVYPTEDHGFFEVHSMEFTRFILELCRNDIVKIRSFEQFAKGMT